MSSERQAINSKTPWWGEHIHRYEEVIKNMNGNEKVLDIACGNGFGSHLIKKATENEVYGGDLSCNAIENCQKHWKSQNLIFEKMDATKLRFPDQYFDIVVSFETIEHSTEFDTILKEFGRVLKIGGILYLSTPNKRINSPKGNIINPFHTQEWYYDEFKLLMNKHFKSYKIFGQKYDRHTNNSLISVLENFFYLRGVRKLPIWLKDRIFKIFGFESFYPVSQDYTLIESEIEIKECKTFFAVCKL